MSGGRLPAAATVSSATAGSHLLAVGALIRGDLALQAQLSHLAVVDPVPQADRSIAIGA